MTVYLRAVRLTCALSLLAFLLACGGNDTVTKTLTGVTITGASAVKTGLTEAYTATASYSDNTTSVVTATWESDTASVLTIDSAGRALGVSAGLASITATFERVRSPGKPIQVVPDYQGTWEGDFRVTRCQTSGAFDDAEICGTSDGIRVGDLLPIQFTLTQAGAQLTGTVDLDEISGPLTGTVEFGGTFAGTASLTITIEGITMTTAVNPLRLLAEGERMTGSFTAESTIPGAPGSWVLAGDLRSVSRTSSTEVPRGREDASFGSWREMIEALRGQ